MHRDTERLVAEQAKNMEALRIEKDAEMACMRETFKNQLRLHMNAATDESNDVLHTEYKLEIKAMQDSFAPRLRKAIAEADARSERKLASQQVAFKGMIKTYMGKVLVAEKRAADAERQLRQG